MIDIKRVDDALIISRTDGDSPILWRCDLQAAQMATFSLKKLKTKTNLIMEPESGEATTVVDFKDHQEALTAFQKVTDVLTVSDRKNDNVQDAGSKMGWLQSLIIFAAFFVILYVLFGSFFLGNEKVNVEHNQATLPLQTEKPDINMIEAGTPILLDDVLLPSDNAE